MLHNVNAAGFHSLRTDVRRQPTTEIHISHQGLHTRGCTQFLAIWPLPALVAADVRIAIVVDDFSPRLSSRTDPRVGQWAAAHSVELAYGHPSSARGST